MKQGQNKNDFFEKVKTISQNATKAVADIAIDIAENTRDAVVSTAEKVNTAIDEKKAAAENARKEKFDTAMLASVYKGIHNKTTKYGLPTY